MIDWDPDDYAADYQVQVSNDGNDWQTVYTVRDGNGRRDYLYLPDAESRYLRLNLQRSSRGQGYGIGRVQLQSHEFSRSPTNFFRGHRPRQPARLLPRYFQGEQLLDRGGDERRRQAGVVRRRRHAGSGQRQLHHRAVSVHRRPAAHLGRRGAGQDLANGYLPIPSVRWEHEHFWLAITVFAAGPPGESVLYARYRLENLSAETRHVTLFLAVRPFQVNPPWQSLNMQGGVSPFAS